MFEKGRWPDVRCGIQRPTGTELPLQRCSKTIIHGYFLLHKSEKRSLFLWFHGLVWAQSSLPLTLGEFFGVHSPASHHAPLPTHFYADNGGEDSRFHIIASSPHPPSFPLAPRATNPNIIVGQRFNWYGVVQSMYCRDAPWTCRISSPPPDPCPVSLTA